LKIPSASTESRRNFVEQNVRIPHKQYSWWSVFIWSRVNLSRRRS